MIHLLLEILKSSKGLASSENNYSTIQYLVKEETAKGFFSKQVNLSL
jgi:hypothetical protein